MIHITLITGIICGSLLGTLFSYLFLSKQVAALENKFVDAENRNLKQWHTICDSYHKKIEENYLLKKKIQEITAENVEKKE